MKYKALLLDLDGTTIPNRIDGLPSPAVTYAIAQARDKIHICIATGRNLELVTGILDHLQLSGPCILRNGSQIYDPVQKKSLKELYIPEKYNSLLIDLFAKFGYKARFAPGHNALPITQTVETTSLLNIFVDEITPKDTQEIEQKLKKLPEINYHKMTSWKKGYYDIAITHPEASKQSGVLEIAKLLHISPQDIIGVGDSYNDFPLLMACGLKFAMGNAVSEVKAIADFIAPSVDNDGVATIINKFILAAK